MAFPDGETMLVDAGGFPGAERMARKPQLDMGEDVSRLISGAAASAISTMPC